MLDSLNVQTYKNFELIIIDGSSKDNTLGIINEYRNQIDIKKFISKIPGIFPSLNLGLKKVSGDIIFILHADNLIPSTFDKPGMCCCFLCFACNIFNAISLLYRIRSLCSIVKLVVVVLNFLFDL